MSVGWIDWSPEARLGCKTTCRAWFPVHGGFGDGPDYRGQDSVVDNCVVARTAAGLYARTDCPPGKTAEVVIGSEESRESWGSEA